MKYYSFYTDLDLGVLGLQQVEVEYKVSSNENTELIGVWFFNEGRAVDLVALLTDPAIDQIYAEINIHYEKETEL